MPALTPHIAVIIPTFGAMRYVRACLESFFLNTAPAELTAIIADDASPDWDESILRDLPGTGQYIAHVYTKNGGLTRGWNTGFQIAFDLDRLPDYIVAGNSDVLVPPGWWQGLIRACQDGFELVGPVTNAPGTTKRNQQAVTGWLPEYALSDQPDAIASTQSKLRRLYGNRVQVSPINGFFMFAATPTWQRYADGQTVFPPRIDLLPSGRKNPAPLMQGQEDWLTDRITRNGGMTGAVLNSFCFHYRSASRGDRYAAQDELSCRRADLFPEISPPAV